MKLNRLQKDVLKSDKRTVVITKQPGSGATTALFLKLIETAKKSDNNLVLYVNRTESQSRNAIISFKNTFPEAKVSNKSNIAKINGCKIKFTNQEIELDDNFITAIAIDDFVEEKYFRKANSISGRVFIVSRASEIVDVDSWAIKNNLLEDLSQYAYKFINSIEHVRGYTEENIKNLPHSYMPYLNNALNNDLMNVQLIKNI